MITTRLLIGGCLLLIAGIYLSTGPISQPAAYHAFADARSLLGVANLLNVSTNAAFLLSGLAGLWHLRDAGRAGVLRELLPAYRLFFTGILLTAFGSGWYHLAPNNVTLVWDRLPMTLGFMSFFAIVIGEQVSQPAGRALLIPLIVTGILSVVYWHVTESAGAGDLRPYALVQFLPMLVIPVLLLAYPSAFDRIDFYWWMLALYVLSKLAEHFDAQVFAANGLISGHSLKHLLAGLSPFMFLFGVARRRPRVDNRQ